MKEDPDMKNEENNLVFVYGTLMRGERANDFLSDADFAGEAVLRDYAMYDLGSYPGIVARKGEAVLGELYYVDDATLKRLDEYEGEGSLYHRIPVQVRTSDGEDADALAYLYAHQVNGNRLVRSRWNMKDSDPVWYAAYGSNLSTERFEYYIKGGVCPINGKHYDGCRDKTLWSQSLVRTVPGSMYFANKSSVWEGKGVAFYAPDCAGETVMRFYRITFGQLRDIQEQEGGWYRRMAFVDFVEGVPAFTLTSESIQDENAPGDKYFNLIFDALTKDCGIHGQEIQEYLKTCRTPLGIRETKK